MLVRCFCLHGSFLVTLSFVRAEFVCVVDFRLSFARDWPLFLAIMKIWIKMLFGPRARHLTIRPDAFYRMVNWTLLLHTYHKYMHRLTDNFPMCFDFLVSIFVERAIFHQFQSINSTPFAVCCAVLWRIRCALRVERHFINTALPLNNYG